MRSYLVWRREGRAPTVVREGFSFWAFLFGPLWLAVHAAFVPAALLLALDLASTLLPRPVSTVVGLGLALLTGLHAAELRGFGLARRGWRLEGIVAARGRDAAFARLMEQRPDLRTAAAL